MLIETEKTMRTGILSFVTITPITVSCTVALQPIELPAMRMPFNVDFVSSGERQMRAICGRCDTEYAKPENRIIVSVPLLPQWHKGRSERELFSPDLEPRPCLWP